MLTENQKKKLIEIRDSVEDKKLRYIITEAIKGWENSKPMSGTFGIRVHMISGQIKSRYGNCCLLGAAAVGKKLSGPNNCWTKELFNLTTDEEFIIIDTFDGLRRGPIVPGKKPHPWFKAIKAIRETVL